ncbi:hypothetical protein COHA_007747 [Chlorella ohadii]|uniref:BCAS3 WD40 domain-containing protein n=1 Tax=Chlorella ohadii TaxID=2649997 RepID=A0AAD5DQ78_9CHLO|nr:hypothetical protein COHA_007747 [Chlorella ohadii]
MGSSAAPGSSYGPGKHAAAAAKQAAGRAALAIGSGLLSGSRLIAKGVRAALADNSDKEPVRFLKFAELEWCGDGSGEGGPGSSSGDSAQRRLPVLLVGLATGFQVWSLDGANPAELVSRRDGPVKLLEVLPPPRCSGEEEACDALCGDRPLLAVVPATEPPGSLHSAAGRSLAAGAAQAQREAQQHLVQLYSLRSHGFCRTLSFSSEVLGLQASGRLLVVALRGQLQAFDAATLQHTFSCLTYVPPPPPLRQASRGGAAAGRRQQQFVTEGLSSSTSSAGSEAAYQQQAAAGGAAGDPAGAQAPAPALAPFALGPRWLAYAADTPVPAASGQAVAQRLPLARRDSGSSRASGGAEGESGGGPGLTRAAVADAALQAAAKGGQQLRAGLAAVGSASFRYLSQQYTSWWQGPLDQVQQQCEADAAEHRASCRVHVRGAGKV